MKNLFSTFLILFAVTVAADTSPPVAVADDTQIESQIADLNPGVAVEAIVLDSFEIDVGTVEFVMYVGETPDVMALLDTEENVLSYTTIKDERTKHQTYQTHDKAYWYRC